MKRLFAPRVRALVLLCAVGAAGLVPAAVRAEPAGAGAPPAGGPVRVTVGDVAASNEKARAAYGDLVAMWRGMFRQVGARFAPPSLARYRGAVRTGCGIMEGGNAAYCPGENAIYYDEVFLAAQAKRTAQRLGTDGDMAAIGVLAHEMGHAVALQLGHASPFTYQNESVADCLAGAFAQRAGANGSLEPGDVDEAFYAMAPAGDPQPTLSGDPALDRRILARAALMGHGTYEQRVRNFRAGFTGGAGACLAEFAGASQAGD